MTEARTYMDGYTDLLEQSFEINLNNYGPEDVERLNDWAINAYAALEALQAEVARLAEIDDAERYAVPPSRAQPPAPGDAAREYMTGYSDGREWAKPSQALVVEPVYQYQLANGNWIDQTKESYDYNVKHGQATVRMLYATPQAAPLYAKEQQ